MDKKLSEDIDAALLQSQSAPDGEDIPEQASHKKHHLKKLHESYLRTRAAKIAGLCGLVVLAFVAIFALCAFFFRNEKNDRVLDAASRTTKPDNIFYSPLTGVEVADAKNLSRATTCVMVENSIDARPQSGLNHAGLVFEALAEGGISRFMAVFQDQTSDYIGPVRSVRLTFAHLAKPYQCALAHVGGATNALNLVRNDHSYRDIDQYFNSNAYWRINSRYAPHNVYTDSDHLDALEFNKGFTKSQFSSFPRLAPNATLPENSTKANTINIRLSNDNSYNPTFSFDQASQHYFRSHSAGGAHFVVDSAGTRKQLAPSVVIAMKVQSIARSSDPSYADYVTTGSGEAFIFQAGTLTTATWRRNKVDEPLSFVDKDGQAIPLARGQTWITLYPADQGAVSWQ